MRVECYKKDGDMLVPVIFGANRLHRIEVSILNRSLEDLYKVPKGLIDSDLDELVGEYLSYQKVCTIIVMPDFKDRNKLDDYLESIKRICNKHSMSMNIKVKTSDYTYDINKEEGKEFKVSPLNLNDKIEHRFDKFMDVIHKEDLYTSMIIEFIREVYIHDEIIIKFGVGEKPSLLNKFLEDIKRIKDNIFENYPLTRVQFIRDDYRGGHEAYIIKEGGTYPYYDIMI